jgi:hypothetical protein
MAELKFGVTSEESPRARFRRHLRSAGPDFAQLRGHLARAVPQMGGDAEARLAVEEIVSHLGSLIGFETARDEDEGVDVWRSTGGVSLVVRMTGVPELTASLVSLARARDHRLAATGESLRRTSALAVVCGSHIDWRQVEETLAVRRAMDRIRLVSSEALLTLAALRADHVVAHPDAVLLLRPADLRADPLIELLAGRTITHDSRTPRDEPAASPGEGAWWIR